MRAVHGGWYQIGPAAVCKDALLEALGHVGQGAHVEDRRTTFGDYLTRRLRWWESEKELKPKTLDSYRRRSSCTSGPASGTSAWPTSGRITSATCMRLCA
jgi:hypothetical protein